MNNQFQFLYIGPKDTNDNLIYVDKLPIDFHRVDSIQEAISFLDRSNLAGSNFPHVILIDDKINISAINDFLIDYKNQFYLNNIDTLIYLMSNELTHDMLNNLSFLTGILNKPLTKKVFMTEIYPNIKVYMV